MGEEFVCLLVLPTVSDCSSHSVIVMVSCSVDVQTTGQLQAGDDDDNTCIHTHTHTYSTCIYTHTHILIFMHTLTQSTMVTRIFFSPPG